MARSPEPQAGSARSGGSAAVVTAATAATIVPDAPAAGFHVTLADFDGPFDLLLSLITKRELDITEVSLSVVTDEFLSYLRAMENDGTVDALDQASEFLVVAVTLLDREPGNPADDVECGGGGVLREERRVIGGDAQGRLGGGFGGRGLGEGGGGDEHQQCRGAPQSRKVGPSHGFAP